MTREEAKRYLEYLSVCSENHVTMAINSRDRQALDMAIKALEQPERKTGRWIEDRLIALNGGSYEVFRCSECQSAFNWRMGYCGHCGAKMEVEHERLNQQTGGD